MSKSDYEKKIAADFVADVLAAGLRPFVAEKGTYGFFTDAEGSRVVSFQVDLATVSLSGNYRSENPSRHGTGWRMLDSWVGGDLNAVLNNDAPAWAVGNATMRYSTLAEHLKTYQPSSKYQEVHRG